VNGNVSGYGILQLRINGSLIKYAETQSPAIVISLEIAMVVSLNAGDYVDSAWNTASGRQYFAGANETHFTGALIG
jgi:hypothetical protein